jgi:heme-degrading monooxygenase HmoA
MGEGDSASSSGFVGLAYGITHEEVSFREGDKGKAGVVMVGWESEAARAAFRDTQTFQEVFGLLRGEAKAIEVLPVTFGQGVE